MQKLNPQEKHPFITWFAANSVVANILMFCILALGVYTLFQVRREGFPSFPANRITIQVPVQGSTPEAVERGVSIKIEEALQGVKGIDHIRSVSSDSSASITVFSIDNYPLDTLLDEVKIQVDAINNFPEEAQRPVITKNYRTSEVMWVELSSDQHDLSELKEEARRLRDTLLTDPDISKIETKGAPDYEISIEPSEEKLRLYSLTFNEVVEAVNNASFDLGGGDILSDRGEIALRARDQAYTKAEFESIPVRTSADGTRIYVRDIAEVRDAFIDQKTLNLFDGKPTVSMLVTQQGFDDIIDAVNAVESITENYQGLPQGMTVTTWLDKSERISSRLDLLSKNGLTGVLLVLVSLSLFLNLRLAFWVALGIPVSLAGAITLFPISGIDLSLNLISAFGFLIVLGVVVDDAIVIGESIYSEKENPTDPSESPLTKTVRGVSRVVTPATFGVITTIAAFLPLTQVSGRMGNVFGQIGTVVIFCLIFSLVESKLILPSHLTHLKVNQEPKFFLAKLWKSLQLSISNALKWFIRIIYSPFLRLCVSWRYTSLSIFLGIFALTIAFVLSGKIRVVPFPDIYNDDISVQLSLSEGQSVDYLHQQSLRIMTEAEKLKQRYTETYGASPIRHVQVSATRNSFASISMELIPSTERMIGTKEILDDWRKAVGPISGAQSLTFAAKAGPQGSDLDIRLESNDLEELQIAAEKVKEQLRSRNGVYDITDTFDSGKPEIRYRVNSLGEAAGITQRELARNVRDAFYGREVQRIQRGRDEIRVMVRYPKDQRSNIDTLRNMRIRKSDGTAIPFSDVSQTDFSSSLASIERYDSKRIVSVQATVDKTTTSSSDIVGELEADFFPSLFSAHPSIGLSQGGQIEQRAKSYGSLGRGFCYSIIAIYILLAISLKSYFHPLLIMSVIPFGIIGAIMGHAVAGLTLSILSMFGILALSGIVVNDSLVMVSRINDLKGEGKSLPEAVLQAGPDRFRAILLTSLTTFLGLVPILLETEVQAQFLKPMAASLGFGILFATVITLLLLPILLIIVEDAKKFFFWLYGRSS